MFYAKILILINKFFKVDRKRDTQGGTTKKQTNNNNNNNNNKIDYVVIEMKRMQAS